MVINMTLMRETEMKMIGGIHKRFYNMLIVNTIIITIILMNNYNNSVYNEKLSTVSFNVNGLCSSTPYIYHLLNTFDIVGISEHWLSGPELIKLDALCNTHNVIYKCHNDLENGPPERGRGYGGVALFYKENIVASPISISCDRIVGIRVSQPKRDICIINCRSKRSPTVLGRIQKVCINSLR